MKLEKYRQQFLNALTDTVSEDATRTALCGVWYTECGKLFATDGHRMVVTTPEFLGLIIPHTFKGKMLDAEALRRSTFADANVYNYQMPPWKNVMPAEGKTKLLVPGLRTKTLFSALAPISRKNLSVNLSITQSGNFSFDPEKTDQTAVNALYLKQAANFTGLDDKPMNYVVHLIDLTKPITVTLKGVEQSEYQTVVMPLRIKVEAPLQIATSY